MITRDASYEWKAKSKRKYKFEATLSFEFESDYGADADGNRGMACWFRVDHKITLDEFTPLLMLGDDYEDWYENGPTKERMLEILWDRAEQEVYQR